MNVWLITIGQRLQDAEKTRTFLLARALIKRGHQVLLWTSAFDHSKKVFRQEHGNIILLDKNFHVGFLKGIGYRKNVSLSRFFDHWIVSKRFEFVAKKIAQPDLIAISLPDHQLACQVGKYALANNIPTIVDIRDAWPDIFYNVTNNKFVKKILDPLIDIENRKVSKLLRNADSLVSMMKDLLDWGLAKAGRSKTDEDRVFFLSTSHRINRNSVDNDGIDRRIVEIVQKCQGTMMCLFVGTFGTFYNPKLIVNAAHYLNEKGIATDKISFVIGGTGTYFEEVKELANSLDNVHFTGWLKSNETEYLLTHASVGIIPCTIPIKAFPNKAFTYMSGGLPLISSVSGELAAAIDEYGFGLNYEAGNFEQLAKKITTLSLNNTMLQDMSHNSSAFFEEYLDCESTYSNYAEHIELIAERRNVKVT